MKIEECKTGQKVKVKASGHGKAKHHFAYIDSITEDLFTHEPLVIIRVLGEDKIVSPDRLIALKRARTCLKKSRKKD